MLNRIKDAWHNFTTVQRKEDGVMVGKIYRPNASFETITPAHSALLAVYVSSNVFFLPNMDKPEGAYILAGLYEKLPPELQAYFAPETVSLTTYKYV